MLLNAGMMTSNTDMWATPQAFFDRLNEEFHFDLDVCATPKNAKCKRYYTKDDDGLSQEWTGTVWMNPPYGREIGKWVKKAYESMKKGATVVCLLPSRTDTRWFHDYCLKMKQDTLRFVKGRLHFNESKQGAPFPSVVVVFSRENEVTK